MVTYNQRDAFQPANFTYSNFGPKWTFDWLAYIKDDPTNVLADVQYYRMGGFARFFSGFDGLTKSYALHRLDLTKLTRTSSSSYEMVSADGSKKIFGQSDGSVGTARKIFLTQIVDRAGNAVSLTYDANQRVVALTDAIGQVTTLTYGQTNDLYKITKVTDPFGRFATFSYDASNRLSQITDVIGLTSQFTYEGSGDFVNALITPYGTNTFIKGENGTTRWLETHFPDGNRDRVEFNQGASGIAFSDPAASVPNGMWTQNIYINARNTYYWSKTACAGGYGDYTKAKIYHWLHHTDLNSAARILESEKDPLEDRVWYNYPGQAAPYFVGTINKPSLRGRVLDDGSTQLSAYEYNSFGNLTKMVDPVGRTTSYLYATNGIDLLETRMTGAGKNELLSRTTFNAQHLPLTKKDAAGQVTTYAYNARGQRRTETDPQGATTTYAYDTNGYLSSVDGPLPGAGDSTTWTYDLFGRVRTKTDESGYTLTFEYDALDRLTKVTVPDGTYHESTYTLLDLTQSRDRAGRVTSFEYNAVRQMAKRTDPLNRVTLFQWCKCRDSKSLTDPMGRTTTWEHDVQGRPTLKQFADGSKISYQYENTTSRLRLRVDEKSQVTAYTYDRDDAISGISYANEAVATPPVAFTYDQDYPRLAAMTDGTGTTLYGYLPITGGSAPGAGQLASVDGPLPNDTIAYTYDNLGRRVSTSINGSTETAVLDPAGRVASVTNALGAFSYAYEANSSRPTSLTYPNGQTTEIAYAGNLQDQRIQRITHKRGSTAVSEFIYTRDAAANRITSWSQQIATQTPSLYSFSYDLENQVTAASVTQGGNPTDTFSYSYDPAANRLTELAGGTNRQFAYNALNELTSQTGATAASATYQWDAEHRLASLDSGNTSTRFTYDGLGRCVGIRQLVNGTELSNRRLLWCGNEICEERSPAGAVTKRFFDQGTKLEVGATPGAFYYTRDHLGSIREVVDNAGVVRARYRYDPFGRRTRLSGDVEAEFGFASMFLASEVGLSMARYRVYDPDIGRWLSRDPLEGAEREEGPNLYAYVHNNMVNLRDPSGLCCEKEVQAVVDATTAYGRCQAEKAAENQEWIDRGLATKKLTGTDLILACKAQYNGLIEALIELKACTAKPCKPGRCKK